MSLLRFFLIPFLCFLLDSVNNIIAQAADCVASDQEVLLDFKNGLQDPLNRLSSWTERDTNCCQWYGIRCDNITGAVVAIDLRNPNSVNLSGEIRPSLMKLKSLRHLDLSFNTFNGIPIPAFFGSLLNLQYLNLSYAGFGGLIPSNLGNLSHLQSLYLNRGFMYDLSLHAGNLEWVVGLVSLKHLSMNGVDLSLVATEWIRALNRLPSLIELHLRSCHLSGNIPSLNFTSLVVLDLASNSFVSKIPDWLVNISTLQHIDISDNQLYGRIPLGLGDLPMLLSLHLDYNQNLTARCSQLFMRRWEKIQVLHLASNKLHGKLPSSIGNLTSLTHLDLSLNAVEGGIPGSIGKLCNLNIFSLPGNNMTGTLPEFLHGTDKCVSTKPLPNLESLDMSDNQLIGKIPEWIVQLESLVELYLGYNQLQGPIPVSIGSLQKLATLTLGRNKLNGTLPDSLGQLSELLNLDVSSNQLRGMVTEAHFSKASKLIGLDLSSNSFTVNISSNWVPPFQLSYLVMGSCALGPSFPAWLKSQNKLSVLDISNASILGHIPNWLSNISWHWAILNMSHNQLHGEIPLFLGEMPSLIFIDLSNNNINGKIPPSIANCSGLEILLLSHNQLHGEIPSMSLGEMRSVSVVDLSSSNLTGRISPSLANCSSLEVLDLGSNNLFGTIPGSLGQLQQLKSLHLSDNHFWGPLPSSFRNLSNLETMDLGNNGLSGIIPTWFGEGFSYLRILILRSNAFTGTLPPELSKLSSLQVLDLARNDLTGSIPASLGDLKAIAQEHRKITHSLYEQSGGGYYIETLVVYTKDERLEYTNTLSLVTSIDLSDNNFTGNIPHEITKLSGLVILNLSRNHITGQIPQDMSNLHQLTSLDLSSNQVTGAIPSSLSTMSFLEFLNLSNNNLLGVIPYTGQMTTFEASTFVGNPGLCGPPLPVKCQGDDGPSHDDSDKGRSNDDDALFDNWFYLSLGLGFAAGILVPSFILVMKRSWGDACFDFVDQVVDKLLWLTSRRGIHHGQRTKPRQRR
ncbi:Leucine-rich repeat [Sesbania bispinosa]|nr:Leucine-rich repeat [Sesbania bispinosa]